MASEEYEEGDKVSLTVSTIPLRKVSFECKAWPYSLYCKQFKPETFGADQGWKSLGGCDGTGSPTMAPVFVSLTEIGDGCPSAWSASKTDYEGGDAVSLTVSDTPERTVVYKCKSGPSSGYCNQGNGYIPGTEHGTMAWELVGHCDGTISPTLSPTPYQGNVEGASKIVSYWCKISVCLLSYSLTLRYDFQCLLLANNITQPEP